MERVLTELQLSREGRINFGTACGKQVRGCCSKQGQKQGGNWGVKRQVAVGLRKAKNIVLGHSEISYTDFDDHVHKVLLGFRLGWHSLNRKTVSPKISSTEFEKKKHPKAVHSGRAGVQIANSMENNWSQGNGWDNVWGLLLSFSMTRPSKLLYLGLDTSSNAVLSCKGKSYWRFQLWR